MKIKLTSILLVCLMFTGCASVKYQEPVEYTTAIPIQGNTIAISADVPEKPKMTTPGASCLLCLAAAAAANSGLTSHTKTLNNDEITSLGSELTEIFQSNEYNVTLLTEPVDVKKLKKIKGAVEAVDPVRDYRPLKQTLGTTHLLIIDIDYVGFVRNYSGYIATSPPQSLVEGNAYLVNLETNQYDWYLPIYEKNSVGSNWKEGPDYPGLTNAYYQSVASTRDKILSTFQASQNEE